MRRIRKKSKVREYAEAIVSALVIAFFLRSFVVEAFKIPSGSMIPTLLVGDHIFVNKFIYGLRVPFTHHYLFQLTEPRRGDVVVFIYPVEEDKDFIKRVVGLPGDRLEIVSHEIRINGEPVPRQAIHVEPVPATRWDGLKIIPEAVAVESGIRAIPSFAGWENYDFFVEWLGEARHIVQFDRGSRPEQISVTVPPGYYFMMGDNRDNSADSREWGFVARTYIKGKAMFVWLSLDTEQPGLRWKRFGTWIR